MKVELRGLADLRAFIPSVSEQLPFATAKALTRTAQAAQSKVKVGLSEHLDRPTPFTKKSIGIKWATKTNLQSRIFVKDIQHDYLKYQIEGGTRKPKPGNRVVLIPWKAKRNQYGNIARKYIDNLLAKSNVFSGVVTIGGKEVPGIWEHNRTGLVLRVAYEKQAVYKPRFPFYKIGTDEGLRVWKSEFEKALDEALESAG